MKNIKKLIKQLILLLPLMVRKKIVLWLNRSRFIDSTTRAWWTVELLQDFCQRDINEYHKFLWKYHLNYADTYEIAQRFGYENLNETRKIFLSDIRDTLGTLGHLPEESIDSVFDVGCSLGYLLRYMETDFFTNANILEGNDIDEYAIDQGSAYLSKLGSKIKLFCKDMEEIESVMNGRSYDVIICTGVLMYLKKDDAQIVVNMMLQHTDKLLAISGLAYPEGDNSQLDDSVIRERDGTYIHNIDAMIKQAGGRIIARKWEGGEMVDGNTIYFLFAVRT